MSKIVKKKYLDVLIESTLKKAGLKNNFGRTINEARSRATKEYQDDNIVVVKPSNEKEMCKYGHSWCGSGFFEMNGGPEGNIRVFLNRLTDENIVELIDSGKMFNQDHEIYELPEWAKNWSEKAKVTYGSWSHWDTADRSRFGESKKTKKPLINEDIKKDLERFNKLTNYSYKK